MVKRQTAVSLLRRRRPPRRWRQAAGGDYASRLRARRPRGGEAVEDKGAWEEEDGKV